MIAIICLIIYNISVFAICATLAVTFNHWWITLFSVLFMSFSGIPQYYRICDSCGKRSESASTYNGALDKARKAGWIHYPKDNSDYCPNCKTTHN